MVAVPSVRVGSPVTFDKLTVFPLFLERPRAQLPALGGALADGTAVVEEVTEGGSVPNLAVDNKGDTLVLFVEGQELRGAAEPRAELVRADRRQHQDRAAGELRGAGPVAVRVEELHLVRQSRFVEAPRGAEEVRERFHHERRRAHLQPRRGVGRGQPPDEFARQFLPDDGDVRHDEFAPAVNRPAHRGGGVHRGRAGLAVAIGGKIVSVDLFDAPETCRKVWPRVISGMVLDSMEELAAATVSERDVTDAVETLRTAPWQPVTPAGAGEDQRRRAARWHGSVLTLDGNLVHGSLVSAV